MDDQRLKKGRGGLALRNPRPSMQRNGGESRKRPALKKDLEEAGRGKYAGPLPDAGNRLSPNRADTQ